MKGAASMKGTTAARRKVVLSISKVVTGKLNSYQMERRAECKELVK